MTTRQKQALLRQIQEWLKTNQTTPPVKAEEIVQYIEKAQARKAA